MFGPYREQPEKKQAPSLGPKITMQYRRGGAMVYELQCAGAAMDVHVCPRALESEGDEWRVEAHSSHLEDAVVLREWGPTPADALRNVGASWREKAPALGLPTWDWDAVTRALATVDAL